MKEVSLDDNLTVSYLSVDPAVPCTRPVTEENSLHGTNLILRFYRLLFLLKLLLELLLKDLQCMVLHFELLHLSDLFVCACEKKPCGTGEENDQ